jgi:hypothetical protein
MMEETDRSSVTLDRRESRDRRAYTERRDNERRDDERRTGADRREGEAKSIDFEDRRKAERRTASERRSDERRAIVQNRRTNLRRSDGDEEIIITEEQLKAFESPPLSPKQMLSQILLAIGVLFLLSQL